MACIQIGLQPIYLLRSHVYAISPKWHMCIHFSARIIFSTTLQGFTGGDVTEKENLNAHSMTWCFYHMELHKTELKNILLHNFSYFCGEMPEAQKKSPFLFIIFKPLIVIGNFQFL